MQKQKKTYLSILLFLLVVVPQGAHGAILFQDDSFADIPSDSIILDSDNNASGNIIIQFGETLAETFEWNTATTRFDLSDDLNISGGLEVSNNIDINLNQLVEARTENLATAPTCDAGSTGRLYHDTDDDHLHGNDQIRVSWGSSMTAPVVQTSIPPVMWPSPSMRRHEKTPE